MLTLIFVKPNISRYTQAMAARLDSLESVFKALADKTRLRILALLSNGEACVCDLHTCLGLPQPKVSRHLAYLRRSGLVATRRDGLWVHYRLSQPADTVLREVLQSVEHALGHVPDTVRDRKHLERATGCCAATAPRPRPDLACCTAPGRRP